MYDYTGLKKTRQTERPSPVDNMAVNGQYLSELIAGYRQLSVAGRGLVGQRITSQTIQGRRGVWVEEVSDAERELEIKYRLEASSSSELREQFMFLNRWLRTNQADGFLQVVFDDEPDYTYYAVFSQAEAIVETSLKIISKFTLLVPDGYKKKALQTSTGRISLTDALEVLPEEIILTPSKTTNLVEVINGDKRLVFEGNYSPSSDLVIRFLPDEVTASFGGRNILSNLQRFSPLEIFTLRDGDQLSARNALVKAVKWRDEAL